MVTIWDVAARAGVSKSTVSLVINSSPLVKEETRQRVLKAIKDLKYVPNYNARSLVKPNKNSIGIIPTFRGSRDRKHKYEWTYSLEQFADDVEDGIMSAITSKDLDFSVIKERLILSDDTFRIPAIIEEGRVDGAVFIGGFDNDRFVNLIKSVDIPVAVVTSSVQIAGIDTVLHDHYDGNRQAVKKLIETGHKRICVVNCPEHYFYVWPQSVNGAKKGAEECGVSLDDRMIISAKKNTAESAYYEFSLMLDKGLIPDAVLASNNEIVLGVLRCLYERNLRVPDDMSVICYEDSTLCGNISPALSAVNIRKEEMGNLALKYLIERMNNPSIAPRCTTMQPYLILRQSVKNR